MSKKKRKKSIALKALQDDSDNESLEDSSDEDGEVAMLTRNFKKLLRRQNFSKTKEFHKKHEGDCKKKTKQVT